MSRAQLRSALRNAMHGGGRGGIRWLLRDEFLTDRAAGAVDGTAAEPGPGTRTVVDTESKVTIGSGALSFAGGYASPVWTAPRIYETGITRAAGRLLVAEITRANTTGDGPIMGLEDNAAASDPFNMAVGLYFNAVAAKIRFVVDTQISGTDTAYSAATSYKLGFVLRATGAHLFIKGGAWTHWTLLHVAHTGNAATLYPIIANYNGVFTSDLLRMPDALWLPTPLVSDGFGSAFGTSDGLGHAEGVTGGIGSGGDGATWSNVNSTWSVSGGKAINTPVLGADVVVNGGFGADTDWTKGTDWTIAAGIATHAGGSYGTVRQNTGAPGWYQLAYTVSGYGVGGHGASSANSDGVNAWLSTGNGTFTGYLLTLDGWIGVYGNSTSTFSVDNVSAKALSLPEILSVSDCAVADVRVSAASVLPSEYSVAGLALNWDSRTAPANGVIVTINNYGTALGTLCIVYKCVAGTWSQVSSTAITYSAGARLVVQKVGTEYRTYYNNKLVKANTISDAGILTGTRHGLFSTDAANTIDDLTIYASGTNGEYDAELNKYIA